MAHQDTHSQSAFTDLPLASAETDPWRLALAEFGHRLRRSILWLLLAAIVGPAAALGMKTLIPPTYKSTVQLLIDPRGFKIFPDDTSAAQLDSNSAINYVESQMSVLKSDRVLLRVLREEHLTDAALSPATEPQGSGNDQADTRALATLQRAVAVTRAERSFIVEITATMSSPDMAARIANAVVKAYLDEDLKDRSTTTNRLTTDLSGRLQALRNAVRDAETRAEAYRAQHGLIGARDRLIVEQRLTEATTALSTAQSREAQARARLKQIDSDPSDLTSIGVLGNDPESRRLMLLLERQSTARSELAQLAGTLGARHPTIEGARTRIAETERDIREVLGAIRKVAKAELDRAQSETANLTRNVTALTAEISAARHAEVELRSLEREVDGNRKILESFETRSREAGEFGQIDRSNLRIVSPARAPNVPGQTRVTILWAVAGAVGGLFLVMALQAFAAIFAARPAFATAPVVAAAPVVMVQVPPRAEPAAASVADAAAPPAAIPTGATADRAPRQGPPRPFTSPYPSRQPAGSRLATARQLPPMRASLNGTRS